jgi:hypothetical protein
MASVIFLLLFPADSLSGIYDPVDRWLTGQPNTATCRSGHRQAPSGSRPPPHLMGLHPLITVVGDCDRAAFARVARLPREQTNMLSMTSSGGVASPKQSCHASAVSSKRSSAAEASEPTTSHARASRAARRCAPLMTTGSLSPKDLDQRSQAVAQTRVTARTLRPELESMWRSESRLIRRRQTGQAVRASRSLLRSPGL